MLIATPREPQYNWSQTFELIGAVLLTHGGFAT